MKNTKSGFTLIELLVVIAIIGILSSVVLVSLNTARQKGSDAKIQATISGIRSAAELSNSSNNNSYAAIFGGSDTNVGPYITSLTGMGLVNNTTYFATSSANTYAISVKSISVPANAFCVDSLGNATTTTWAAVDSIAEIADANGCLP